MKSIKNKALTLNIKLTYSLLLGLTCQTAWSQSNIFRPRPVTPNPAPIVAAPIVATPIVATPVEVNLNVGSERQIDLDNMRVLALDVASPLSIFPRIMARSVVELEKNSNLRQMILSSDQLCTLFSEAAGVGESTIGENIKAQPFQRENFSLVHHLLVGPQNQCGGGILNDVTVIKEDMQQYRFVFNFRTQGFALGGFVNGEQVELSTSSRSLEFIMKRQESAHAVSGSLLTRLVRNDALLKTFNESVKSLPLALDVYLAVKAIKHFTQNQFVYGPAQLNRILSNYTVFSFEPIGQNISVNKLTEKKGLLGRVQIQREYLGQMNESSIIVPPALANTPAGRGYRRGVLFMQNYLQRSGNFITTRLGETELKAHISLNDEWAPVVLGALQSVGNDIEKHFGSLKKYGIGIMYGPKAQFATMKPEVQANEMKKYAKEGVIPPTPKVTSCIGFVFKHLGEGFKLAGKENDWKKIEKFVRDNDSSGPYLMNALREYGWTTHYFNPDTRNYDSTVSRPSKKAEDHHIWINAIANREKLYLKDVPVTNKILNQVIKFPGVILDSVTELINYRPTLISSSPIPAKPPTPAAPLVQTEFNSLSQRMIREIPFFVGTANGGYHVFLGSQGMILESHSTREPTDPYNIEVRPFNHWGLEDGENYLTGVIAVPPSGFFSDQ